MFNWIFIPVVSALIGWITNWVAVKMLFKPKNPWKLFGMTIQGIFPRHQLDIADKIGRMVADELLSVKDIREKVSSTDQLSELKGMMEKKIDEYLHVTFPSQYPITAVVFGEKRRNKLRAELLVEMEKAAPEIIHAYMDRVEESFDVAALISEKVAALDVDKLENLIFKILEKELAFIEWIGALMGFAIGILQVLVTELISR
jgi:uncharacterized membrane protein YheB (UPF0754 family)